MDPEFEEAEVVDFQEFIEPEPEQQPQRSPRRPLLVLLAAVVVVIGAVIILSSGAEQPAPAPIKTELSPEELQTIPASEAPAPRPEQPVDEQTVDGQINQLVKVLKDGKYPKRYRFASNKLLAYLNDELPFPVSKGSKVPAGGLAVSVLGYVGSIIVQGPPSSPDGPADIRSIQIWTG